MSKPSSIVLCKTCGNKREEKGAFAAGWAMSLSYEWTCDDCHRKELQALFEKPYHQPRAGRRGIYDATGRQRDRDWLRNKLEITATDKKWHADIKARKLMPDGSIRRVKR